MAIVPDNSWLLTIDDQGTTTVRDIRNGELIATLLATHTEGVASPDGRYIAD